MSEQNYHIMEHTEVDYSTDKFYCPTCSRLVLIHWDEYCAVDVLNPGDVDAIHTGSIGGLHISNIDVMSGREKDIDDMLKEIGI